MARYLAILALALVVLALGVAGDTRVSVEPISRAHLLLSSATTPPPLDDPGWSAVLLPDDWRVQRPAYGGSAWYRITIPIEETSADLWAAYLPRINMNAAVYLNGHYLGSGGAFSPQMARNWNRPLYFGIPGGLLQPGDNILHVQLKADAWAFGQLGRLYVGPDRLLRDAYEEQYFIQITFIQAITLIMVAMAVFMAMIWVRRRQDSYYGWFALASLVWAVNNTNLILRYIPLPLRLWEWLANLSLVWMIVYLSMFGLRYLGKPQPRMERLMFVTALAGSLIALFIPERWFFPFLHLLYAAMILCAAYVLALIFCTFMRERSTESGMLSVVGLTLLFIGTHDLLIQFGWFERSARHALHQGSLVLFLVIGGILVNRFVHALRAAETLTQELEQRVADKHREIERNYERMRELEREQVLVTERERLMRDMHDGMGGQLVAALAQAEQGNDPVTASIAEALRTALDDLRLMIDSLDPVDGDLIAVLGMLRSRMEMRLAAKGVQFRWLVHDLPAMPGLGPNKVLQVLRILQEALCNILKHAQATTITVSANVDFDSKGQLGVCVGIADDGIGISELARIGRGLANMRHRAAMLGGALEVRPGEPGTTVQLWLPME